MVSRYGIIKDGVVVNVVMAKPEYAASKGWVEVPQNVAPGWLWDGNDFAAPEEPKQDVPSSITPRQCRLLLLQQGLLSQAGAMVAQSTEDVRITWEYALEFRRDDPLLNQLATNLGLTTSQVDEFFIEAAKL